MPWLNLNSIRREIFRLETLKVFIGIFSAIWTFLECGDKFGVITISQRDLSYFMGIVAVSMGFSIANALFVASRLANYQVIELSERVINKLKRLQKRVNLMIADRSYFKLIFADWRIETELEKSKMTDGGHFTLPAKSSFNYIIYVFSCILNRLRHSDEYITLSNIDFWAQVLRIGNNFLTDNLRAIERRVTIRRIILVDRNVLESFQSPNLEKDRIRFVVSTLYNKYQRNTAIFEGVEWYFYISDNYPSENHPPVPYAIMYNKILEEYLAVLPRITGDQANDDSVELHFSQRKNDDNITPFILRVNELLSHKTALYSIPGFYDEVFHGKWK